MRDYHGDAPANPRGFRAGRRRRRPAGEPPPLPRRIGVTGWWWVGAGILAIVVWLIALANAGGAVLPVDQWALEALARLRTPALTRVMEAAAALGSRKVIIVLGWTTILVLVAVRRFRHLFVFLGSFWLVQALATYLANGVLDWVSQPRPAGIAMLGPAGQSAYPMVPVAMLSARLVGMLYALIPQGRRRQQGKAVVAGIIALVALARMYLAIDTPTGVLVASVLGVTIPLVAFRWLCPDEVFPVTYRRGRTAHLDVGGRRGEAIRRALHDQLGVIVEDVQPFALEGSAGSTPLRIKVKGDEDAWLFAKLYAKSHLRADRSYKLGRALLYGRLEDEKPFNTVRRFVQQEDYALSLMQRAGLPSPEPYGVVELSPERETWWSPSSSTGPPRSARRRWMRRSSTRASRSSARCGRRGSPTATSSRPTCWYATAGCT
jgi:hypothetical protein